MAAVRRALMRLRGSRVSHRSRGDRGATFVEYGLVTVLFVGGLFGVVALLNGALTADYGSAESRVSPPQSQLPQPSYPSVAVASCTGTDIYVAATNTCEPLTTGCTGATPFYNPSTNRCEAVTTCTGTFYNATTNRCEAIRSCPGEVLNTATNQCVPVATCTGQFLDTATNTCRYGGTTCTGTQVWSNATAACTTLPTPTLLSGTLASPSVSADNDAPTTTFPILAGTPYGSAPYVVTVTVTGCARQAGWTGGTGVTCTPSGGNIVVDPASNSAGVVLVTYTYRISWPTSSSTTATSAVSAAQTVYVRVVND